MIQTLLIESDFGTPTNGFLQLTIDDSQPVKQIIQLFCEAKRIEPRKEHRILSPENKVLDRNEIISAYSLQNNSRLIITSSDMDKRRREGFHNWNLIGISAIIFSLIGFIACICVYVVLAKLPDSYAIVIDAGSTHTEVILYRWEGNKLNNTGVVMQESSCNIKGGIANIESPSKVPSYLDVCIQPLISKVPKESIDYTEIFFGATAGMRILRETDEDASDKILKRVKDHLESTGLIFKPTHANIISGSQEGAAGWLTLNYLNNALLQNTNTWGALDLGGASTQISFLLEKGSEAKFGNRSSQEFRVYGKKINVFSQSFLCYGLVQALIRYRTHLILNSDKSENMSESEGEKNRVIMSPCEHFGYNTKIKSSDLFSSPCSPKISLLNKTILSEYTFIGSSKEEECESTLKYLLSSEFCKNYNLSYCISTSLFPPNFHMQYFMGFSALGYVYESLKIGPGSKEHFELELKRRCSLTLNQLVMENIDESGTTLKNLQSLCFKGFYILTLIGDVYGFGGRDWDNIKFGNKIEDKELGWALGFMVNETESIVGVPRVYGMNTLSFTLLILLFSLFIILSLALLFHSLRSKRNETKNEYYDPIPTSTIPHPTNSIAEP